MFKKHSAYDSKTSSKRHYWFTIVVGDHEVTSKTYTTAAMRDKGIEACKKVVKAEDAGDRIVRAIVSNKGEFRIGGKSGKTSGEGWKVSEVKRDRRFAKKPADVFHIEDKKGKIEKR